MSPEQPAEGSEWRAALLTYVPAILVAVLVNWALTSHTAWAPRRALIASIAVGIAIALLLERVLHQRARRR